MEADLGNGEAMLPEDMSGSRHNTVRKAQLAQARKATVGTDSSGGSTYISRAIEADMRAGRADPDRQPQSSIKRHEKAIEERTQIEYKITKKRKLFGMPNFFRSNGGKMRRLDSSFVSSARASPAPSPSVSRHQSATMQFQPVAPTQNAEAIQTDAKNSLASVASMNFGEKDTRRESLN